MDTPEASIFHVQYSDNQTRVRRVFTSGDKFLVGGDLGYRASDLLQTNCIIWVEGPSDRIYINHWIHDVDKDLIEGLHYSIMFYGGRLLSHLSADDSEVNDFISLRSLNRNTCILIDSDKTDRSGAINSTKKRICDEFQNSGYAWVTAGRTIENYLSDSILNSVLRGFSEYSPFPLVKQYADTVKTLQKHLNKNSPLDKVKLARAVTTIKADLSPLDLAENIQRLVTFIQKANSN